MVSTCKFQFTDFKVGPLFAKELDVCVVVNACSIYIILYFSKKKKNIYIWSQRQRTLGYLTLSLLCVLMQRSITAVTSDLWFFIFFGAQCIAINHCQRHYWPLILQSMWLSSFRPNLCLFFFSCRANFLVVPMHLWNSSDCPKKKIFNLQSEPTESTHRFDTPCCCSCCQEEARLHY